MKNSRNTIHTFKAIVLIFAFVCTTNLIAQIPPAGPPPGATDTDDAGDTIPLDGGLAVLLAGAAMFGIKKLRDNKKN